MSKPKAHVAKWKKEQVKKVEELISKYKIIGIADLTSVGSNSLQVMKRKLKPGTEVYMTRANLLNIVFKNLNSKFPNIEQLGPKMRGMTSLVLTNDNPFKLASTLNKSKIPAPAKAGDIAPGDIKIPAGPTAFPPGPIIGELGQLGIKTGVEAGKVSVKAEKVVVKAGEEVPKNVATVLTRLQINPMEIGINLIAAYENGKTFDAQILNIDEKEFNNKLMTAISDAAKLAYSLKYFTKENIKMFLQEAQINAAKLADSQDIITSENVSRILGKAEASAQNLKTTANIPDAPQSPGDSHQRQEDVAKDVLKNLQDKKIQEGKT